MEDIVQRVFSIIFAVLVFFIMPIYMTFEKRDDISYALALKITSNFVNQVKSKGYLTQDMYDDFISDLTATNNTYDVKMQHKHKVYNPVINVYDNAGKLIDTLDYSIYEDGFKSGYIQVFYYDYMAGEVKAKQPYRIASAGGDNKFVLTYKQGEMIYNEEQILNYFTQQEHEVGKITKNYFTMKISDYDKIDKSSIPYVPVNYVTHDDTAIYKMPIGDEFTVAIRNNNITLATVLFDALTFGGITSEMPRVYINYGGIIKSAEYNELSDEFAPYDNNARIDGEQMKGLFNKYKATPSVKIYIDGTFITTEMVEKNQINEYLNKTYYCNTTRGYTTYIYLTTNKKSES